MKKTILWAICIFLNNISFGCNLCWDYRIKDPRLIREDISHDPECTCPCWKYPHTQGGNHLNNFYKCEECGHRLTPPDPLSQDGPQYKRFYNKKKDTFKPTIPHLRQIKKSKN